MSINTHVIEGKALFFKALPNHPVKGYPNNTGPEEWTFDLQLDDEGLKQLKALKVADQYIKTNKAGNEFIRFNRKVLKRDGSKSKPFSIVNHKKEEWEADTKIGNGSILRVQFTLNEVGTGKDKRLKPSALAVQVWKHVPFSNNSAFETREDTPEDGEALAW